MSAEPITQDMIDCWRVNYGLDTRSPADAARWWDEHYKGMAPAGAVAALGLLLAERATLDAAVAAARAAERASFPRLLPVIEWLELGCDPMEAAKELRIYDAASRDLKPEGE